MTDEVLSYFRGKKILAVLLGVGSNALLVGLHLKLHAVVGKADRKRKKQVEQREQQESILFGLPHVHPFVAKGGQLARFCSSLPLARQVHGGAYGGDEVGHELGGSTERCDP